MQSSFSRFSEGAGRALQYAQERSQRRRKSGIHTGDLLLALIRDRGIAGRALAALAVDRDGALAAVEAAEREMPETTDAGLSEALKRAIERSVRHSAAFSHTYVGTEHLLLGLLDDDESTASRALQRLGVDRDPARRQVTSRMQAAAPEPELAGHEAPGAPASTESQALRSTPDPWQRFAHGARVVSAEALATGLDAVNNEISYRRSASGPGYEAGVIQFTPQEQPPERQITHADKDVICSVLQGRGRLRIGSETQDLAIGSLCHIPAGTPHDFAAVDGPLVLSYVSILVPPEPR